MKPGFFHIIYAVFGALAAIFAAAPAGAAVVTTGCVSSSGCTLTELYDGGSITVNDVTFDAFALNFGIGVDVDSDAIFVTGVDETTPGVVGLTFMIDPALELSVTEFVEYDWDFNAAVNTGSRLISDVELLLLDSDVFNDAFFEINADVLDSMMNSQGLLQVFEDIDGVESPSALELLTALNTILFDFDIQGEAFEFPDGSSAFLRSFQLLLTLEGEFTPTEIPLPAAFPLMLAGIAGLGIAARRKRCDAS